MNFCSESSLGPYDIKALGLELKRIDTNEILLNERICDYRTKVTANSLRPSEKYHPDAMHTSKGTKRKKATKRTKKFFSQRV